MCCSMPMAFRLVCGAFFSDQYLAVVLSYSAIQSQRAVSAYSLSKQILYFFAEQYSMCIETALTTALLAYRSLYQGSFHNLSVGVV